MKLNKAALLFLSLTSINALADINSDSNDINAMNMLPLFEVSAIESDPIGFVGAAHFTNYLTPTNAFGFEVDFGGDEFRLGGTWSHVITDHQRFKITAEHFAQKYDINFYTNTDEQWAGQNDVGGIYQYLLNDNVMKNFYLGGYYTHAETENVADQPFTNSAGNFVDIQRFAGANSGNALAGLTVQPWANSRAQLQLDYSQYSYNTLYTSSDSSAGPGAAVAWEQLFNDHWKAEAGASFQQPFNQYMAGLFWLANTRPGTRLELGLSGSRVNGDFFLGSDTRGILSATYSWGGDTNSPRASYANENPDNWLLWTAEPVIAMPTVLIKKDEAIRRIN